MKRVLLTGASRGIGFATAKTLLQEGYNVTGTARKNPFPKELTEFDDFDGLHADISSVKSLTSQLKPLILDGTGFDVLINNAGIFSAADMLTDDETWLKVWDETMFTNLRGATLLCKWFIRFCLESGRQGAIINMASRAAYRGDDQQYAAYAASKGGLVAFTKSVARAFGRNGITAFTVAPGFVETDMASRAVQESGIENLTRDGAFSQLTQPDEVASLVAFIASGKVQHMTGTTFHINGGSYLI